MNEKTASLRTLSLEPVGTERKSDALLVLHVVEVVFVEAFVFVIISGGVDSTVVQLDVT